MRDVNCYICESGDASLVVEQKFVDKYLSLIDPTYNSRARSLVVCDRCGLVYRRPQIDEADATSLYQHFRDSSVRTETPDEYFDRISSLPADESENHAKLAWLHSHISDLLSAPGKRVLDIGCGGGVFLHKFLKRYPGWDGFGVEPTPAFADLARRRAELEVAEQMYQPGIFGDLHTILPLTLLPRVGKILPAPIRRDPLDRVTC